MASTSIDPINSKSFDYAKAAHLLNRAGFGGTPQQITAMQTMGLDRAVDHLVDYQKIDDSGLPRPQYDSDLNRQLSPEDRKILQTAKANNDKATLEKYRVEQLRREQADREQMSSLEQWWLGWMISSPRPLEEKLTLLWHGHFASNHRTIRNSYLMLQQNVLFLHHANGNFGDLALGIIRDPAMLHFLNNDSNRKDHPNENLAREIMELFTLGVGNYTEDDIKQGARALTGYSVEGNDFRFRPFIHDNGQKVILGRRGTFDGDAFVRILLDQPACPMWVSYKLYKHFVGDIDDRPTPEQTDVIRQLARVLVSNHYELSPVLKTIFKSEHFYDPAIVGNQIKSPAQMAVGAIRVLQTPQRDLNTITDAMALMGQKLFDPPSVAGWGGGREWINTSTLFGRQNLATFLLTGKLPFDDGWDENDIEYDPGFLIKDLPSEHPPMVIDHLMATLIGPQAPRQRRDELIAFVNSRGGQMKSDTLVALLLLITAMPEYQLC